MPILMCGWLVERLEIDYTPKHGSWLNTAETKLSVLTSQCMGRRHPDATIPHQEAAAWKQPGRQAQCTVNRHFTSAHVMKMSASKESS